MSRLRFGIFLAPFHPAGENPTLALQRDLELVEHLDRLGYDEAWIGEHHSAGCEIIASPGDLHRRRGRAHQPHQARHRGDLAAVPQPVLVAERMVLLDHLTRGRAMLGVGPGSLPTDSAMIGLDPTDTRDCSTRTSTSIMRLLRSRRAGHAETATGTR